MVPAGMDFDQRIAARFVLSATRYSPGEKLKSLRMPVLLQVAMRDNTNPPGPVIRACEKAPSVELI